MVNDNPLMCEMREWMNEMTKNEKKAGWSLALQRNGTRQPEEPRRALRCSSCVFLAALRLKIVVILLPAAFRC
jgi:hypothetical protein